MIAPYLPHMAFVPSPVQRDRVLVAAQKDRLTGQALPEGDRDRLLLVRNRLRTQADLAVPLCAVDLEVTILSRAMAGEVYGLQGVGDMNVALGIDPDILAPIAMIVALVIQQVERHPHTDAHGSLLQEMELRGGVVLLADQYGLIMILGTGFGAAYETESGGKPERGMLQTDSLVLPIRAKGHDAAFVFGEAQGRDPDSAFPVRATIYEYAIAFHIGFLHWPPCSKMRP